MIAPHLGRRSDGITCDQATARKLTQAQSVWEIVAHIAGWEDVFHSRCHSFAGS